jgi:hypothetical protein
MAETGLQIVTDSTPRKAMPVVANSVRQLTSASMVNARQRNAANIQIVTDCAPCGIGVWITLAKSAPTTLSVVEIKNARPTCASISTSVLKIPIVTKSFPALRFQNTASRTNLFATLRTNAAEIVSATTIALVRSAVSCLSTLPSLMNLRNFVVFVRQTRIVSTLSILAKTCENHLSKDVLKSKRARPVLIATGISKLME